MKKYYYVDEAEEVQGPVSVADLARFRFADELTDDTDVREEVGEEWIKLSEVDFSVSAAPAEPAKPAEPVDDPVVEQASSDQLPASPIKEEERPNDQPATGRRYFVWPRDSRDVSGPLTLIQIKQALAEQRIAPEFGTVEDIGQSANTINTSEIHQTVEALLAEGRIVITRRSGWATFATVAAALFGVIAAIGFFIFLENEEPFMLIICVAGIAGCIQFAFLSFLINVFTDVRWYLSELVRLK
jgi:hypothetical protein